MDETQLREINVSKYLEVSTTDVKIGSDIDHTRTRHIWRIIADSSASDTITLYSGDEVNNEREIIGVFTTPTDKGNSIQNPIITIRPNLASDGTTINNQIYAKAETGPINLTIDYYDE